MNLDLEKISLVTGKVPKDQREEIYKNSIIIAATTQTINNDLNFNRITLENFSLIVFDKAHRAVKDYAYPYIAKRYILQAKNPFILALTAPPGENYEKIEEIKDAVLDNS